MKIVHLIGKRVEVVGESCTDDPLYDKEASFGTKVCHEYYYMVGKCELSNIGPLSRSKIAWSAVEHTLSPLFNRSSSSNTNTKS